MRAAAALPSRSEERLQQGGAFLREDPGDHGGAVVQAGVRGDPVQGGHGAALGILRPVDDLRHPGRHGRAGAHGTGLQGDDEAAARKAVVPGLPGRLPQGEDLGVRGGILRRDGAVVGAREDLPFRGDDHGAHRDLSLGGGFPRLRKGRPHPLFPRRQNGQKRASSQYISRSWSYWRVRTSRWSCSHATRSEKTFSARASPATFRRSAANWAMARFSRVIPMERAATSPSTCRLTFTRSSVNRGLLNFSSLFLAAAERVRRNGFPSAIRFIWSRIISRWRSSSSIRNRNIWRTPSWRALAAAMR